MEQFHSNEWFESWIQGHNLILWGKTGRRLKVCAVKNDENWKCGF